MPRSFRLVLAAAFCIAGSFCSPAEALAVSDNGFQVSPTSINTTIAVGDRTGEAVTLHNHSSEAILVKAHISDEGGGGGPLVILEPQQVSLDPGGSATVIIRVQIPDDLEVGNRHLSVLFDAASRSERDVAIIGQVGVALSLDVIHPVADVRWSLPHLIDSSDVVTFSMEGRNSGNFTTALSGTADISGLLGAGNRLQTGSAQIAVGETAKLQAVWDEAPLFDISRVTLDISSGIGVPVENKTIVLIFPWKLTTMLLLMATVAAAGAWWQPELAKVLSPNGRRMDS